VLARYSNEPDVVFGATVAGRPAEISGVATMMGLFINTLPVRAKVVGAQSVGSYLKQLQIRQAGAREYEYSPLIKVQEWSEVRGKPLFESLVVFENYPVDQVLRRQLATDLSVDQVQATDFSTYPLTLIGAPGKELALSLLYSRHLFDPDVAKRLLRHFSVALMEMIYEAERPLHQIFLLSDVERCQVLSEWNGRETDYPHGKCINVLFEEQVVRTRDAIAAEYRDQQLSYEGLNLLANKLAHYLRKRGVGPDIRVGICVERSLETIVAMLAVLKAGGAYVPLDADFPAERLAFMLSDSGVRVLITRMESQLKPLNTEPSTVYLDKIAEDLDAEPSANPEGEAEPTDLAYVMYTSGSTGTPKGVAIPHRGIARLLFGVEYVRLAGGETILQLAPLGFDASTFEIWGALLHGGRLVLYPERTPTLEGLEETLRKTRVTCLWLTGSLFNFIIDARPDLLRDVRQILTGGEALSVPHIDRALEALATTHLINGYGPTEGTTFTCCYRIPRARPSNRETISIGGPISNTVVYVLDASGGLAPVGVAGELYIGGDGLAREYLNRPDLTAEKFLPNPFARSGGERLYATGDWVRWSVEGTLEFLGRRDNQVKIRGFRIELSEIEAAMRLCPGVREAAVFVHDQEEKGKQLVGFVVPDPERPELKAVQERLREVLPDYMAPSALFRLDSLPLTPNGKLDRQALATIAMQQRAASDDDYVAPRNPIEEELCRIWAKLLKVEGVSIHDNFFELGGDSILSIQVITRAREAGLQLTPRQIFEHSTIAELSQVVITLSVAAEDEDSGEAIPLTPIQAAFFEWGLKKPNHYNQAVLLKLKAGVDSELIEKVLIELLRRHEALRMRYERNGDGWSQWCDVEVSPDLYERLDLSGLGAAEREAALEEHASRAQESLDVETGRLVRAVEYQLGAESGRRLLLVIHHLAVDGVSWRILLQDLERGYQQLRNGEELYLGKKTATYRRWAEGLRQYSRLEELKQELEYWCAEGRRGVKRMPRDEEASEGEAEEKESVILGLGEEETRELLQGVPKVYHTQINDVLLAALGRVCGEWSGSRQVLVDLEGHGREEVLEGVELSETVGWFTTIYPALLETGVEWEVGRALRETKEQLRRTPNRGLGYGVLRYLCEEEECRRRLMEMPEAELSFNYLGQFDQVFEGSILLEPAKEKHGRSVARENESKYGVEVGGMVVGGRLQMVWSYNGRRYRRETIERIAGRYLETLREVIEHCRSEEAGGYTPSDFPLANLTQEELSQLASFLQTESDSL
jgi:amino acid adenylation domain-containing protein/non-ribosomal peptide synthase protein (TIGR01720 family)